MTSPRILYVDDDDGLRRLIQRALSRRGFDVTSAASADEGLDLISSQAFDLIAIDNHMPGKSGRQMLDEIVAMPDHPPVVFVTGNDDTTTAVEAIHAGALDFVVKTVGESFFDTLDGRFRQALTRDNLERDKRKAEADLRIANEHLELMVREVHHRVSNSLQMVLSFVAMQAGRSRDSQVKDALESIQNRVRAISKVHQRLYNRADISTIDLHEYLGNLAVDLRESVPDIASRITLKVESDPVDVPTDMAISLGVIVNELVSNAAKYAFPCERNGTISIRLERLDQTVFSLSISDDGVGIAPDVSPEGTGLGTRIISATARGLGSEVETRTGSQGTMHRLVVKRASR